MDDGDFHIFDGIIYMLGHVRPSVATNSHVEYTKDFGGASYLDPVLGHIFVLRMRAPLLRETLMYNREG